MVNFVRDIDDPYSRAQAHAIVRSLLVIMVMIPEAAASLKVNDNFGLDMAENIRRVPDEPRRRAYLATFFRAIVARLDPEYPSDPRSFYMSCFV